MMMTGGYLLIGTPRYRRALAQVAADGYAGFRFRRAEPVPLAEAAAVS